MSIFENAADLLHELKVAAGTVLTILGSKLEADARARVECGPQWLTEIEEQRDVWEPHEQFEGCCTFHAPANFDIEPEDSAAVSAAADPSPTVPNAHSVVGDCPGSDSVILPTVEPGPQTAVETGHDMGLNWACEMFPQHQKHAPSRADASAPPAVSAQTCSSDGRADAVAIAESVTHEDLYMHLVRAAHRANTGHVDVLIEEFTNSLLADFSIVKREGK